MSDLNVFDHYSERDTKINRHTIEEKVYGTETFVYINGERVGYQAMPEARFHGLTYETAITVCSSERKDEPAEPVDSFGMDAREFAKRIFNP
jgi:hypothetical protein